MRTSKFQKNICLLLCLSIFLCTAGCGTILYPERKGQKSGQVDKTVAIMDGLLVLFGIIPGILAIIIDVDNGCIYMSDPGLFSGEADIELRFRDAEDRNIGEVTTAFTTNEISIPADLEAKVQKTSVVEVYEGERKVATVPMNSRR